MGMDASEIERYLDVSLVHSIVVDVREVSEAPGNLRAVTIRRDYRVTIEFETCDDYIHGTGEGAGLKYVGQYGSLAELVQDLEAYLGRPVSEWKNYTSVPYEPQVIEQPDPAANFRYFEDLVREKRMQLPARGGFELAGIYWRQIDLFGEYSPARFREMEEMELRRRGMTDEEIAEYMSEEPDDDLDEEP